MILPPDQLVRCPTAMSSASSTSLFTSSKAFCRSRNTAAALRFLFREIDMSCNRMLIASRVPDPGLKPVALFGELIDHLSLFSIIFSINFPITGSSEIVLFLVWIQLWPASSMTEVSLHLAIA